MPEHNLPYVTAYGSITKALDGIKKAQTPDRFTQDFLAATLGLKGGSPRPVIPFLKKTGFLGSDGTPTPLYKRFRNSASTGAAAAEGLRKGFAALYQINESAHNLKDSELRGVIVQATGLEEASSTVKVMIGSFKALKAFADFNATVESAFHEDAQLPQDEPPAADQSPPASFGLNLGYTINLNLPATSDIAVFNAIFRSLREHLLR